MKKYTMSEIAEIGIKRYNVNIDGNTEEETITMVRKQADRVAKKIYGENGESLYELAIKNNGDRKKTSKIYYDEISMNRIIYQMHDYLKKRSADEKVRESISISEIRKQYELELKEKEEQRERDEEEWMRLQEKYYDVYYGDVDFHSGEDFKIPSLEELQNLEAEEEWMKIDESERDWLNYLETHNKGLLTAKEIEAGAIEEGGNLSEFSRENIKEFDDDIIQKAFEKYRTQFEVLIGNIISSTIEKYIGKDSEGNKD